MILITKRLIPYLKCPKDSKHLNLQRHALLKHWINLSIFVFIIRVDKHCLPGRPWVHAYIEFKHNTNICILVYLTKTSPPCKKHNHTTSHSCYPHRIVKQGLGIKSRIQKFLKWVVSCGHSNHSLQFLPNKYTYVRRFFFLRPDASLTVGTCNDSFKSLPIFVLQTW